MNEYPNLAGTATAGLVEKIGAGSFSASYINWSRTMHLLRVHAPGWLPVLVHNVEGGILHRAPVGCYLLIKFKHLDGSETPAMPQAIMDSHNKAIALERVTARDITDTHRRGICMAAAMTFGLAYELWAKMPLESGYAEEAEPGKGKKAAPVGEIDYKAIHDAARGRHAESVAYIKECLDSGNVIDACNEWALIPTDDQRALWLAPSKGGCLTTTERATLKDNVSKVIHKEKAA